MTLTTVRYLSCARIIGHLAFFFSSRRRHTRCSRDWSSDVCSSDLVGQKIERQDEIGDGAEQRGLDVPRRLLVEGAVIRRSEERRVGKECRARDYLMQHKHNVIALVGDKTSYDADNSPLLVMRSNHWASCFFFFKQKTAYEM